VCCSLRGTEPLYEFSLISSLICYQVYEHSSRFLSGTMSEKFLAALVGRLKLQRRSNEQFKSADAIALPLAYGLHKLCAPALALTAFNVHAVLNDLVQLFFMADPGEKEMLRTLLAYAVKLLSAYSTSCRSFNEHCANVFHFVLKPSRKYCANHSPKSFEVWKIVLHQLKFDHRGLQNCGSNGCMELQHMCRVKIRESLSARAIAECKSTNDEDCLLLAPRVEQLHLPKTVKKYLLYDNCEHAVFVNDMQQLAAACVK
jgi:SOCS box